MSLVVLENIPVTSETIIIIQNYVGMKDTFFPVNDVS